MRPKGSELDDASNNCPQQSWRWGELPSPPVTSNRTSPPKSTSGSISREVLPGDHMEVDGTVARASNATPAGNSSGRQSQTTAEGILLIVLNCISLYF